MTTQTTKIARAGDERLAEESRPAELRVGTVLWDRYEVLAVLGTSQMGEVWQCFDRQTRREVGIRWLSPDLRRSKKLLNMLHAEIRRISDKTHPNMAIIRQLVHAGEHMFVVGDYALGVDAGTWARSGPGGRRSPSELLPILHQIAAGLDFAHKHRIIHGNLSPTNVFLAPDGTARVTDFGLPTRHHLEFVHGRATRAGATGAYLAPELLDDENEPDSGSDQYALAVLVWDLLAGAPPSPEAVPPADWPASVREALRKALSSKPRNRFATCEDFARALAGERVTRRRGRSAAEWRRIRHGVSWAVLVALLGGAGWGVVRLTLQALKNPAPKEAPAKPVNLLPEARAPEEKKKPVRQPVTPLVATTPLPVEGQPWVTLTGKMEFVWVPPMRMWVGRFEVTNDEFGQMDPAHDSGIFRELSLKEPRQPVVRVNFEDCAAFAAWLTAREREAGKLPEGWRYRLPSRHEAITYTRAGLGHVYPWGDGWPPTRGNYGDAALREKLPDLQFISGYEDGFPVTALVEDSGENPWGLFGAGGNVWETTSKVAGGAEFGGWHGGGWDDYLPARTGCEVTYGFLGNARGAVNGLRLVLAPIAEEAPPPPAAQAPANAPPPG